MTFDDPEFQAKLEAVKLMREDVIEQVIEVWEDAIHQLRTELQRRK